jgi:RNA polymerase sigma-70 factor, ECF subfamily
MNRSEPADFECIVNEHERTLYQLAQRIVGNRQDAEEVVQDAFVRAHRALSSMPAARRESLRLRAWLYTITRNAAINRLRSKRLAHISIDAFDAPDSLHASDGRGETPESILERMETTEFVEQAIRSLPQGHRATAQLRFVDGFTYAEIAERFSQPIGTVKSRAHRAAIAIRKLLRASVFEGKPLPV